MARRALPALLTAALAAASALGGCGEGGGASRPLEERSGAEVIQAVQGALRDVGSYRVTGTFTDEDGPTDVRGVVRDDGSVRAEYVTRKSTVAFVVTGGRAYVRGDLAYWRDFGTGSGSRSADRVARALADRWVILPPSTGARVVKDVQRLMPDEQAYCLPHRLGTLTVAGRRTVGGRPVLVVRDAGDVPGGTPGEIAVALDGPPLPVREEQTGPTRPGGPFDPRCDDDDDTTTRSLSTITYDRVPPIRPPRGARDPRQLVPRGASPALPGSGLRA